MDEQPNGDDVFAVTVFLLEDQTFTAFYIEGKRERETRGWSSKPGTGRRIEGTWKVVEGALLLSDSAPLLSCQGITVNGADSVACKLTREVISRAAKGETVIMKFMGPSWLEDSGWDEYKR